MHKDTVLRSVFLIIGIALLAVGIFFGDFKEVFLKASKICYECIGIG